jgi:pimeloyl-ACP methyl ester carboxylesterase
MIETLKQLDARYSTTPLSIGHGDSQIDLFLRRLAPHKESRPAVLLLHGGNTNAHIFSVPNGGLARYLHRTFDVWLLDWRGSTRVQAPLLRRPKPLGGSIWAERKLFTLDRAAEEDVPIAVAEVHRQIGDHVPLSIVGYCLSSGVISMAAARGTLPPYVQNLVLLTLGLFFNVPWNGWIKAEDYLLEHSLHSDPEHSRVVDPNQPETWPNRMQEAYASWPARFLPPVDADDNDMLKRLSFMVGQPWSTANLHDTLRGDVRQFFGPFHLGFYLHCGQIVRRGYAAPFDAPEVKLSSMRDGNLDGTDLCTDHFDERKHLTIVCAQDNGVWHREAADRMYDWLRSYTAAKCEKRVIAGYNLHELLWGATAAADVYPIIERGLQR